MKGLYMTKWMSAMLCSFGLVFLVTNVSIGFVVNLNYELAALSVDELVTYGWTINDGGSHRVGIQIISNGNIYKDIPASTEPITPSFLVL